MEKETAITVGIILMLPLSIAVALLVLGSIVKSENKRIRKIKKQSDQKRWKGIDCD